MKKTLLEMVQSIMSSMDSDEVNSISDTAESLQVAGYIRDSYYEIISGLNLPNTFTLFGLDPSLDATKPTIAYLPSNCSNIRWIKYNRVQLQNGVLGPPDFQELQHLDLESFLMIMYNIGSDTDVLNDIGSFPLVTSSGQTVQIYYRTDKSPSYWTSFDDNTIIFDSFDSAIDSTIVSQKCVVWGEQTQTFLMEDNFVPVLADKQFTLLENEAKQQAFVEAKQSTNPIATQRAHKGWVRARREKHRVPYSENSRTLTTTNFGRRQYAGYTNGINKRYT